MALPVGVELPDVPHALRSADEEDAARRGHGQSFRADDLESESFHSIVHRRRHCHRPANATGHVERRRSHRRSVSELLAVRVDIEHASCRRPAEGAEALPLSEGRTPRARITREVAEQERSGLAVDHGAECEVVPPVGGPVRQVPGPGDPTNVPVGERQQVDAPAVPLRSEQQVLSVRRPVGLPLVRRVRGQLHG